ncbi:MAG: hypothetical protein U0905_04990 [Pirellulales bacterium]
MKSITVNIPNANYLDIKLLMAAIMKELPWLTHINWIHPELSEDEQKDLSSQFPETIISISGAQE